MEAGLQAAGRQIRRLVPARAARAEILVVNSRFIASAAPVFSVEKAREYIASVRQEFADASHKVPAFIIGHGASTITHCSDDGEPPGTAGRPALAVLQGSGLGDVVVVVTRYFGGTKLGTGGLVKAYSEAVRAVLVELPRAEKAATFTVFIEMPYAYFERVRLLAAAHGGSVLEQDFGVEAALTARFLQEALPAFQVALRELSRDTLKIDILEANRETILPLNKAA